jgi:YaiO family outer membrane protein
VSPFSRLILLIAATTLVSLGAAASEDNAENYKRAVQLRNSGKFAEATILLRDIIAKRPDDLEALHMLGMLLGFQKQYDEAAQVLEQGLARAPQNGELRLTLARVKGWAGKFSEAETHVDALLKREANNVEAVNFRARLAYYQGRHAQAEAGFREALRLVPGNLEAMLGIGDSLAEQGDKAGAEKIYGEAATQHPSSEEAKKRLSSFAETKKTPEALPNKDRKPWKVSASYVNSSFDRSTFERKDWREGTLGIAHELAPGTGVLLEVRESHRNALEDTETRLRLDHRFLPWLTGYAALAATPEADFLPRWDAQLGSSVRLLEDKTWPIESLNSTWLTLDLRQRHYKTGNVRAFDPGLQQYLFGERVWATGKWLHVYDAKADKHMNGWLGRMDWQALDYLRMQAGRSKSPETDSGASIITYTSFGGIVVQLFSDVEMRLDFSQEKRTRSFIRNEVTGGLNYSF